MPQTAHYHTIVVGSGLAGLTTALKLSEKGFSVALVEKTASLGGNSIKASSGINGVPTKYQNNDDTVDAFIKDTNVSGKGLCDKQLVEYLAKDSASAITWLTNEIKVDLSAVSQLGGHSFARTHRGSGKLPPGFAIVSALTKRIKESPNVEVMTQTSLQSFSKDGSKVQGVVVDKVDADGAHTQESIAAENVVLATGGFSADTDSQDSLIRQFRQDLIDLPSTNGQQTTGDGHRLANFGLDAKLVQMDQIQVHPTGFVQLKDATTKSSKWKFLCGELIRGIGGILLSSKTGKRFVDELSTRDNVTAGIMSSCDNRVAAVIVSEEDYKKAAAHIDFYMFQSLMFKGTAEDLCVKLREIDANSGLTGKAINSSLQSYNNIVKTHSDPLGRTHFGHEIGPTFYYFGFITPVLHFTMGGVETNEHRQIVQKSGVAIPNVYAVGELSAGVHGANRLAGSSLLECVVFGTRVADHISRK
ncbi:hypothetical protein OXX59_001899 [Metschnikowia pulcherrima]